MTWHFMVDTLTRLGQSLETVRIRAEEAAESLARSQVAMSKHAAEQKKLTDDFRAGAFGSLLSDYEDMLRLLLDPNVNSVLKGKLQIGMEQIRQLLQRYANDAVRDIDFQEIERRIREEQGFATSRPGEGRTSGGAVTGGSDEAILSELVGRGARGSSRGSLVAAPGLGRIASMIAGAVAEAESQREREAAEQAQREMLEAMRDLRAGLDVALREGRADAADRYRQQIAEIEQRLKKQQDILAKKIDHGLKQVHTVVDSIDKKLVNGGGHGSNPFRIGVMTGVFR